MDMAKPGQPMPAEGAPAAPEGGGGGASKIVADVHSGMMKLMDLMQGQMPQEAEALGGIVSQFQQFVDSLGQAPGAKPQGPAQPGTTSPEAGAANVKPAM